jgi:hypothetical protein
MGQNNVLEYKIMKWILTEMPAQKSGFNLVNIITNRIFLAVLLFGVLAVFIYAILSSLGVV